jgi:hypothetical protein
MSLLFDDDDEDDGVAVTPALIVPGMSVNSEVLVAENQFFKADACPAIFESIDELSGRAILENAIELRRAGFRGRTVEDAEKWLMSQPRNPDQEAKILAAVLAARGEA